MKLSIGLLSLCVVFSAVACPSMEQADHVERQGFKIDMPLDKNTNGTVHQHASDAQPHVTLNQNKTSRPKPTDSEKKGRMHKS